jgi:hypothetical protein
LPPQIIPPPPTEIKAVDTETLKKRIRELEEELSSTQKEKQQARDDLKKCQGEKQSLEQQLKERDQELEAMRKKCTSLELEIKEKDEEGRLLKHQLLSLQLGTGSPMPKFEQDILFSSRFLFACLKKTFCIFPLTLIPHRSRIWKNCNSKWKRKERKQNSKVKRFAREVWILKSKNLKLRRK